MSPGEQRKEKVQPRKILSGTLIVRSQLYRGCFSLTFRAEAHTVCFFSSRCEVPVVLSVGTCAGIVVLPNGL